MQDWKMTDWKMTDEVAGVEWRSTTRANVGMYAFLGHLQNTTVDNMNDVASLRNGLQIRRPKLKANLMNEARIKACVSRFDSGAYCSSCVLWATLLVLTPTRYSPANTPTVPTTTTTTTSSWHRLLPARRPQRWYQERQLLQTHHHGVVKFVCWHPSKALPWCPADTQDSARTVHVA